ncbi:MAG: adenylosuccinate lyase [Acidaminococcaceae bacterium]|nr:adenylosuccinate lyase [Acidaminococcaceae bacterium]HCJ91134.1 adenylosuccinate lyase [Acidaminococcaceae bacterium]
MIPRYTRPGMGRIWDERNEWQTMLDVEIAACEANAELGRIPKEAVRVIKEKADFEVDRIHEIDREINHDIIAFLTCVGEHVGDEAKYIHMGLTSTDVKDTGLNVQIKQASEILIEDLEKLAQVLKRRAVEFKHTPTIGRTHGVHAEPTTFGLKLLLWYSETLRNIGRMKRAADNMCVGKLSGAVGTYADIDPYVEEYVCRKMGLKREDVATQVVQRDHHAEYITTLGVIAGTLSQMALEIRHLQRTEVREAEEYFSPKQKGSSAMPHKRNPVRSERICGMARVIQGYSLPAFEDIPLWHERDISHSSVERVIFPDATIALDYILDETTKLIDKLLVYPDKMLADLNLTGGLIYSPRVLLALVAKGAYRDTAYRWVQRNAMKRWLQGEDFYENLCKDEDVRKYLDPDEIKACFDYKPMLIHVDEIFARFGL